VPSWDAREWGAFGTNLIAIGGLCGGGWALYNYRRQKRAEAARWLQDLFKDLYTNDELVAAREIIEYEYDSVVEPLVQLRVTDRHFELTPQERENLRRVDLVLNLFEQVCYLKQQRHLRHDDVDVFFAYWFDQLRLPERAALRRYLARCGYERCAEMVDVPNGDCLALYGTLMGGFPAQDNLSIRSSLRYIGPCRLPGHLYDMGDWPSFVLGDGAVDAELYEVLDMSAFQIIDPFERYDPRDRARSGYIRRCVRLADQQVDAWTYVSNEAVADERLIASGSWSQHVASRGGGGGGGGGSLRRCTGSDAEAVRAFVATCPPLTVHTAYTYWTTFRYLGSACYVLEDGADIVAYISALVDTTFPGVVFVWQIAVAPSMRGRRTATRLLDAVAEVAIARGSNRMQYTVEPANAASLRVFERYAQRRGTRVRKIGAVPLGNPDAEPEDILELDIG